MKTTALAPARNIEITEDEYDKQLLQKADMLTSEFTSNGGILTPTQSTRFIRKLVEQPTILNVARFITMPSDTHKIPKIGIGSRILRAAAENTALTQAQRSKPVTTQVTLTAKEVIAEVLLPYTALEDNIEGQDMATTVLDLIAEQSAIDLEELMLLGDSAAVDADADAQAYLRLHDGFLKRITTHVVNHGATINYNMFNNGFKSLAPKYRANRGSLNWILAPNDEADYGAVLASRATGLGDTMSQVAATNMRVQGIALSSAALMPQGKAILTNPKNLIIGLRRRFTLESEKLISSRQIKFVLTARVALAIEEEEACVKVTGITAS